jgi:phosphomethylpyrimidine synthase
MTQFETAQAGRLTEAMKAVAAQERVPESLVLDGVRHGRIVIPANPAHTGLAPMGIGAGLRIKVNANLGTSPVLCDLEHERAKLQAALAAKADAVMDLSSAGDITAVRRALIAECPAAFGTVPIYQAATKAIRERKAVQAMTAEDLFAAIEEQARDGVDFLTVHCGITRDIVHHLRASSRRMQVVSRGGAFLACWILANEEENPLYAQFDRLLEIARAHDVTLSLGDGMRPGCLADATDSSQVRELLVLGELVQRARAAGVQAMVEGPGHVPLDQVAANVVLQKRICDGAPFYVLGPLVTDIAPGYDHITSAIGGAVAGMAGADFLCYVTPAEHLALPTLEEVREGVIASRIAAHAADLVRLGAPAREWDDAMATARRALDWKEQFRLAVDPERAAAIRQRVATDDATGCTMCGEYCVFKLLP